MEARRGITILHKAETKDDSTLTDSSVALENMRACLSLVTLTRSAVPQTTCTRTSTQRNTRRGARGHPGLYVN